MPLKTERNFQYNQTQGGVTSAVTVGVRENKWGRERTGNKTVVCERL